ncbi:hypothetical protein DENIS_2077 [Desulfonema ishimotonii]|uniref:Roadblock/LAMTOR2 domain-containing protein n=1 Tax=Desulfonema ishimotonii TaxID=45657 RepID=A0A401FVW3_9BACT|nr:hypothetical protein [Desulfonema ishimotonii]GBC61117.1 hypothetical protein DENIS_2077 [Desulfonema ishimotonii]
MKMLKDSSEIREAASLFDELIAQSAVIPSPSPGTRRAGRRRGAPSRRSAPAREKVAHLRSPRMESGGPQRQYRGDRLEDALYAMCKRGGFMGALLVDSDGLPLAIYNRPVADETLAAAFTMILGDALGRAGKLLSGIDPNNISIDINYTDKAVIRRFSINNLPYFLMTVCPQNVDERAEVELSIDQVTSILKKR